MIGRSKQEGDRAILRDWIHTSSLLIRGTPLIWLPVLPMENLTSSCHREQKTMWDSSYLCHIDHPTPHKTSSNTILIHEEKRKPASQKYTERKEITDSKHSQNRLYGSRFLMGECGPAHSRRLGWKIASSRLLFIQPYHTIYKYQPHKNISSLLLIKSRHSIIVVACKCVNKSRVYI